MPYVDLRGLRTWYEERGSGDPLVLMHGGVVDSRFFEQNVGPLSERFHVYTPDRRGHGRTPDVEGPMTFEAMVDDTVALLEDVVGEPAHLVGHSNGAFVGLLTALSRPDLIRRLVLVSGGFHRDGLVPMGADFDPDAVVAELGASYGEVSPDGEEHFRIMVEKTAELESKEPALPEERLREVQPRTLLMFGDDDLVTMEHINAIYEGIPDSELAIVPGTSHFLLQEKAAVCNQLISDFLSEEPKPTVAPIRRAPAGERKESERAKSTTP
jgi:pimeloyl-ACP methyl ester carboxylesterase